MSFSQLESSIVGELRDVLKNSRLRKKDLLEWSTGPVDTEDGEVAVFLPGLMVNCCIKAELDKRPKLETYNPYRRKGTAEIADWHRGFDMTGVSVSEPDKEAGSPKEGDKIARNSADHADRWLISAAYFEANFEPVQGA